MITYDPYVEKMGPLRGDGNLVVQNVGNVNSVVEKMGPLRGDGNSNSFCTSDRIVYSREDGSPSWGRKRNMNCRLISVAYSREDGSPSWGRKPYFTLCSSILE